MGALTTQTTGLKREADGPPALAAAERLGAPIFFTEDLNHNQVHGSVRAQNPFLDN